MSTQVLPPPNAVATGTNRRLLALAGFTFPLMFAVSFVVGATTMVGDIPRPGSSASEVFEYYQGNPGVMPYVRAAVRLLSAATLALFAICLATTPKLSSAMARWRWPIAATGVASAVALAVSPTLSAVAHATMNTVDPQTLVAFREWNYLIGGTVHLAVLGGYAALVTIVAWDRLSRTLRWLGGVTAVTGLAVPLLEMFNPLARFASWAWVVALTVAVLRHRDRS